METKRNLRLLLLLILCSVLFSQTAAWLPSRDPSVMGNAKHADAVFTNDYSSLLGPISTKKYLESLIGKWVSGVLVYHRPVKRQSDAVFTDQYSRLRKKLATREYLNSLLGGSPSKPEEGESESQ